MAENPPTRFHFSHGFLTTTGTGTPISELVSAHRTLPCPRLHIHTPQHSAWGLFAEVFLLFHKLLDTPGTQGTCLLSMTQVHFG